MGERDTGDGVGRPIEKDWGWQISPEEREARRRARHGRWIAGLSERDWTRLAAMADAVMQVRALRGWATSTRRSTSASSIRRTSIRRTARFGMLRGCILMAWDRD